MTNGDYESARKRARAYLDRIGMSEGGMGGQGGDYAIEPGTGDHMHIQFNSAAAAQKYLDLTTPKVAAPAPFAGWTPDALAKLKAGASPHLNGDPLGAGASGGDTTHINAPQTTQIHIDGASDPSVVAHMVASNQSRVNSDMSRNLLRAAMQ